MDPHSLNRIDPTIVSSSICTILSKMTLEEKASLLAGVDDWHFRGIPRLGIPSILVTDCGHGVTLCGDRSSPATCFPTAIGMASTWNEALLEKAGAVIGKECRTLGCSMLLGPMVNLHRLPINGRSFENFSEDPVLTGRLGAALIRGIQSQRVGACIKVVVANNQQQDQEKNSSEVDERTLRELYLRVFEIALELSAPSAIMTSYNRLNGKGTSENRWLINDVIKGEWKFPGIVISDWRAVRTAEVYQSGLDLEMPGPGKFLNTESVMQALKAGLLSEADLNDKAGRIIRVLLEYGQLETGSSVQPVLIDSPEHRAIALEVAEESIVLLKNKDSILPLDSNSIRRLLVIGPNAAEARLGGGGSASVTPFYSVSPLEGIKEACLGASVEVEYREGCSLIGTMRPIQGCFEFIDEKGQWGPGLKAEFFNQGKINDSPDASWNVPEVNFSWGWATPGPGVQRTDYSVRFTGRINPSVSGHYTIGLFGQEGFIRMSLDGKWVVDEWPDEGTFEDDYKTRYSTLEYEFKAGSPVEIVIEYGKRAARGAVRIEWEVPGMPDPLQEAARLAGSVDAVIVCAGLSNLFEGGSRDRTSIELPATQQRLIEVMSTANPRTIVALFNGGALAMPWESKVPAILEAWYPGQEGGRALARILFGAVNPSGKLPDTVAYKLEDHAASKNYPGDGNRVIYEERLSIGYRHFDTAGIEPHYPFGFGLSYTTFEILKPELDRENAGPDESIIVRTTVKNSGTRAGKETVQLYVRPVNPPVERPEKELKRFQKVELQPGEQTEVLFTIGARDLAYYDLTQSGFVVAPGQYEILVGSHSRALKGVLLTIIHS